jgi:mono/diheme cytochrome c family protein
MIRTTILISIIFFISSCSGNQNNSQSESSKIQEEKIALAEKSSIPPAVMERGEIVYRMHCLACHQSDGSGNPGMYPPLIETKTVNGDLDKLVEVILHGQSGEIEVKGEIYNQVMIPHNFLSDKEIADVLTYLRNSFGNTAGGRVTEEEVSKIRSKE